MARPKKVVFDLKEKLEKIANAGLEQHEKIPVSEPDNGEEDFFEPSLNARIKRILNLVHESGLKPYHMLFLVMYDIGDNRVRHYIAKYLLGKGCVRIQKSVYLGKVHQRVYKEIHETLTEVQSMYENADSILIAPVQASMINSMKIIGKDIQIQTLIDPPNTLFY